VVINEVFPAYLKAGVSREFFQRVEGYRLIVVGEIVGGQEEEERWVR
jgi:hypothetical protein